MCAVSQIYDWADKIPLDRWNNTSYDKYQECVKLLRELDALLGEPDCEDSSKTEFIKKIKQHLE